MDNNETVKFEVGKTYIASNVSDYPVLVGPRCRSTLTVAKRSAKFIWTTDDRFDVRVWDGEEFVKPWGAYCSAFVGADARQR